MTKHNDKQMRTQPGMPLISEEPHVEEGVAGEFTEQREDDGEGLPHLVHLLRTFKKRPGHEHANQHTPARCSFGYQVFDPISIHPIKIDHAMPNATAAA